MRKKKFEDPSLYFKKYYEVISEGVDTDGRNRIERPETDPLKKSQLIFYKVAKPSQRGKAKSFQQMIWGNLDIYTENNEIESLPNTIYSN